MHLNVPSAFLLLFVIPENFDFLQENLILFIGILYVIYCNFANFLRFWKILIFLFLKVFECSFSKCAFFVRIGQFRILRHVVSDWLSFHFEMSAENKKMS